MRQLPRLLRAVEAIGGDLAPDAVPDRLTRAAAELADARYAALAVLDEEGEAVGRLVVHGGTGPGDPAGRTEPLVRALLHGGPPPPPLTVPVLVHGAVHGLLHVAGKRDGAAGFTEEDRRLLGVLATEAGLAIGNARLHEAVRQQARWMDGSLELTTSLLAADEDNALAVVAEQARRLADAATGVVLEPAEGENLEVVAASGEEAGGLVGTVVPARGNALRRVLAGEPVVVDDPRAADPTDLFPAWGRGPGLLLPLASDGTALGALALARAPGSPAYTVPERALATQFAQQAALALLLSRARRDRERLAVLADRDRIARDLHDLVIQRLFAVGMVLEGARRAEAEGRDEIARRIARATDELDATVQEIRTTVFALQQPPEDTPAGLRARVLRETGAAAATLGFPPSVAFTGPVDALVGEETARNLVAALREGLSNAARHAGAHRVEVAVDATARLPDGRDAVRLTVADDGRGLPAGQDRSSGLRNLARRAESLGGSAALGPGLDGAGTALTWQAPR
ncbi:GAF domain-containing protein [Streptomyces hainanensis]|uniref:GAF domain-containing protein n=1 Tax=Streptomyces hainanensis TaxID=402648 RepID=A0A4R4T2X0_9ACTN|nr:GAF domain-containing protein [Streptomyces hainanensis]TDC70076.1 GAF domain-containing protein [Streptomyces hainanensis]